MCQKTGRKIIAMPKSNFYSLIGTPSLFPPSIRLKIVRAYVNSKHPDYSILN